MTWRHFMVLLRGLSPNSATVTALSSGPVSYAAPIRTLREPKEITAYFARAFGATQKSGQKS